MKSLTAVCPTGVGAGAGAMPAINAQGRAIGRHQHPHRENAEMKMYLSKLKDLVPFMPKNRKLSKLEIIQHVIDYICDLQSELETHPEMGTFDAASALNFAAAQNLAMDDGDDEEEDIAAAAAEEEDVALEQVAGDALTQRLNAESYHQQQQQHYQQQQQQSSLAVTRQPLVDRQAPNTILPACNSNSNNNSSSNVVAAHQQQFPQQHQPQQQPQQQSPLNSQTVG